MGTVDVHQPSNILLPLLLLLLSFVPFSATSPVFTTFQTWITWLPWDTFYLPFPLRASLCPPRTLACPPARLTHSSNSCPNAPHPLLPFSCGLSAVTAGFSRTMFTNSHAQPRLTAAKSKSLSFRSVVYVYVCVCVFVRERTKLAFRLAGTPIEVDKLKRRL